MAAKYGGVAFQNAIHFYRDKVRLPTARWTDIWQGMHTRAFTIAGAMKDDLLLDFQKAIDKSIANGGSLKDFRKDFDTIVSKHGWGYNGGRNWRSRVIYDTNMRTAYQAGRYQQMQQVKSARPYWRYHHSDAVENPRHEHLAWNGLVLHADDPFWNTHYPPNGWGCRCSVQTLSPRDLNKLGKTVPDSAPSINSREVLVGQRGPSPRTVHVPEGIDAGWAYNVGEAAWGRQNAVKLIAEHVAPGWKDVGALGAADFGRPFSVPIDKVDIKLAPRAQSKKEVSALMSAALGSANKHLVDPTGAKIRVGDALVDHIFEWPEKRLDGRETLFGLIPSLVEDPYEIWVSFAKHEATGKYAIRKRYVKYVQVDKKRVLGLVGEAVKGEWVGLTVYRGQKSGLKNLRKGTLIWGR